jgi:hypothetical protein
MVQGHIVTSVVWAMYFAFSPVLCAGQVELDGHENSNEIRSGEIRAEVRERLLYNKPIAELLSAWYLRKLTRATYQSIVVMVEPSTGLPHDRFDPSLFDIMPQFPVVRAIPWVDTASGASLESMRCTTVDCPYSGNYGLKLTYNMPEGTYGSYNVSSPGFDVSKATYLEVWTKGAQGGERFEFVLWSDCQGSWPGRPNSAEITVSQAWEQQRIRLADFQPYVDISSLCRLSVGFNNAIDPGGTIYLDAIAFVDADGNRIPVALDETTNVTNIGLYIASMLGALDAGWEDYQNVVAKLSTTLTSIEAFQKWHGLPQTHNHVVSLTPSTGDLCISTVDLGNLAAGLILLRQRIPELSDRASALLNAMEWDWLYDNDVGLPYGCRFPDGSVSAFHYNFLAADSRLAHFIAIGTSKMPPDSWSNLNRDQKLQRCAGLWHFEPGWDGGGLFMQFLPGIFLDEADSELGTSACNFAQDQICYAQQIGAPAWGWSATALPPYGEEYCGYGCERDDILVPHASILAADCLSSVSLTKNLLALSVLGARPLVTDGTQTFDFGFRASVNWELGEIASVYLVLDQSMAFLSLVNRATHGGFRDLFCEDEITSAAISLIPDYMNSCGN